MYLKQKHLFKILRSNDIDFQEVEVAIKQPVFSDEDIEEIKAMYFSLGGISKELPSFKTKWHIIEPSVVVVLMIFFISTDIEVQR